ncbi:CamS family sex pheromone protein [Oceanobacillus halophilus]|uniref:CamS family sex pheromone protein n=1 Tax=Oceanobacillus halophilus TaxID=930130 RepID=A0A495A4Z4_9BACI|nr:CamS family sex pheromone protein [Oceanobacillus halophilus]RKQ34623.1 CamS family sex pheromone protein [Oceanobacillus halophilus]
MKRWSIALLSFLLILASCAPEDTDDEQVVQENEDAEQQTSIVPSYKLNDESYRVILPYQTSEARGVITNQMGNRVDIDELEQGLMRHSKDIFDPEELYFQEGQYLNSNHIFGWIDANNPQLDEDELEDMEDEDKIKTYKNNPRILTHILEQNYLKRNEDNTVEIAGISIGIALKSVYRFQTDIGEPSHYEDIPMDEMLEKGNEVAQAILTEMRVESDESPDVPDVPIMIALYREEEHSSPVPGNFVAKTVVESGQSKINNWDTIKEENILFPSNEGKDKYPEDHEIISSFGTEIGEFFPNYVGVIGRGFYVNEELRKLTIEIPIEFYGKGEVIGFTQYTYGLIMDMFANNFDLEVRITSSEGLESLITREYGDEEPTVNILD